MFRNCIYSAEDVNEAGIIFVKKDLSTEDEAYLGTRGIAAAADYNVLTLTSVHVLRHT